MASILLSRLVGALLGLLRLHLSEQYLTFVSEAEALDAVVRLVPVRALCKLAPDISKRNDAGRVLMPRGNRVLALGYFWSLVVNIGFS